MPSDVLGSTRTTMIVLVSFSVEVDFSLLVLIDAESSNYLTNQELKVVNPL